MSETQSADDGDAEHRDLVERLMHSYETAKIVVFTEEPFHMAYFDKGNLTSSGVNTSALRLMARNGLVVTETGHRHVECGQHAPTFSYENALREHDEFMGNRDVPMERALSYVEVRTLDEVVASYEEHRNTDA